MNVAKRIKGTILIASLFAIAILLGFYQDELGRLLDKRSAWLKSSDPLVRSRLGFRLGRMPDFAALDKRLAAKGLVIGAPVFVRIFKQESVLELWMQKGGRHVLFASYPICRWSGNLGPKFREGDKQSPEGFYSVSRLQLNPNSRWHRSFNVGFPNAFDRANGRTGSFIMVHGGCSSVGCFAVTNPAVDEIWRIVKAALDQGQPRFHVHIYPFRMTDWNMALHRSSKWSDFWKDLKTGYDRFESDRKPPLIRVCNKRYVVEKAPDGRPGNSEIKIDCRDKMAEAR